MEDWENFYPQAFRCCNPGGYVENLTSSVNLHSDDGTMKEDSALKQWGKVFCEGGVRFGKTFSIIEDDLHRKAMEKVGFVDIVIKDIKVPISAWPQDEKEREKGIWVKLAWEADLEGYVNYLWGVVLGWTQDEIKNYMVALKRELNNTKIHSYYTTRVAYA